MVARLGMLDLILRLRSMTDAQPDEFEIAGETYWSNDQLNKILDRYRYDEYYEAIEPTVTYDTALNALYQDYYFARANVEELTSGSAVWKLEDSDGNIAGTADYSVNYQAQHIRFNDSTDGGVRYLTYRYYDLNKAASDVWSQKAASVASRFNISTDNHTLSRAELRKSYLEMAAHYKKLSGGGFKRLVRVDLEG